jgi:multidrug efflux pump subunit AcrA (membrane-fusion protein)
MIVEVDVPNPDDTFKAGMYASVVLITQDAKSVLGLPLQALSAGESPSVLVVDSDNRIEEKKVIVGMRTASVAEIKSGLSEGDLVVVGDRAGLVAGAAVTPKLVDLSAEN